MISMILIAFFKKDNPCFNNQNFPRMVIIDLVVIIYIAFYDKYESYFNYPYFNDPYSILRQE